MRRNLGQDKGQHLLVEKEVIDKEIKLSELSGRDCVLEIGAGSGNLTKELARTKAKVTSYEIDLRFQRELSEIAKQYPNLSIVYSDALKGDWRGFNKIVSNIPYHLSEQTITKAIISDIPDLFLIVGEKFKEKLVLETKIGLVARKFYDVQPIIFVGRENFFPVPRVDSWLIHLKKKKNIKEIDRILLDIIFSKGKIKNALLKFYISEGKTKNEAKACLAGVGLGEQVLEKPSKMITAKLVLKLKDVLERQLNKDGRNPGGNL